MGPFGRVVIGSIVSKDIGKKKDAGGKEGNKNKKGAEENEVSKGTDEDALTNGVKKDAGEKWSSARLFSWSKDDSSRGSGEKVEKGRRTSAPGKVQTNPGDSKAELTSFLSNEFGSALGLNRIKTRSGPLYTTSTRSGPVFAGTLQSRFNIGNEKSEEVPGKDYSSCSPGVRKAAKAAKVHARDSVSPKDSFTEGGSNCRGRRCLEAESREVLSSCSTEGSSGPLFVPVSNLGLGSGKLADRYLSETNHSSEDAISPSGSTRNEVSTGQVSQPGSASSLVDIDSNFDTGSIGRNSMRGSFVGFQHARSVPADPFIDESRSRGLSKVNGEAVRCCDLMMQDIETDLPKEIESPRFQALLRMTGGPRKGKTTDIKSFSHELDPRGMRSYEFPRPHNLHELEEVMAALGARFHTAKDEVNAELAVFAGDLVEVLESCSDMDPYHEERIEDLLVLAREYALMDPQVFRRQCEAIVQELDDKRQELPMGILKRLHTRMLFILTRCTRLLQFEKENGLDEDELHRLQQQAKGGSSMGSWSTVIGWKEKGKALLNVGKNPRLNASSKPHIQDGASKSPGKRVYDEATTSGTSAFSDVTEQEVELGEESTMKIPGGSVSPVHSLVADPLASWKNFTIAPPNELEPHGAVSNIETEIGSDVYKKSGSPQSNAHEGIRTSASLKEAHRMPSSKRHQRVSWGHWTYQTEVLDDNLDFICRICEDEVATSRLEEHSRVCALADRCDQQGLDVDDRLRRIAETLERMAESFTPKSFSMVAGGSPETAKTYSPNNGGCSSDGGLSERCNSSSALNDKVRGELLRRGSEEMLEDLHEIVAASIGDDNRSFNAITCKTRFGPKVEQSFIPTSSSNGSVLGPASSAGSLTPRSPLTTPRISQIDLLLSDRNNFSEVDDTLQLNELADIARCIAGAQPKEGGADNGAEYIVSCLHDLQDVLRCNKVEALAVATFGKRIEKLCMEKYHKFLEILDPNAVEAASSAGEEEILEDDTFHSFKSTPVHLSYKDRTTIDDFEIIKPISRGAFGRVFLARKCTTGDLFAIKVLRKADMIRKNAVESVKAERNILISARNPFVVRFFYSFTCRDNLYLVMEYLNGGDMYSMLRNLGYLEESLARVYVAELVLALECLHSLGVVHRDLKPDNILIAHDGHIKLTDFGLSRVGLINSTDDLSGPATAGTMLMEESVKNQSLSPKHVHQRKIRQQRSAVGTPDYLAPEILLGTSHGPAADWWSTGVILFEFLTGIPPFNAEYPQIIFDNILNRHIPWPAVPEYMSHEAQDLIDKLLTEDPNERLGAKGAAEVKAHPFFKDINWDTLARQKAAFIPSPDGAHDTSYFASRYAWNSNEGNFEPDPHFDESDDESTSSGSTSDSDDRPEEAVTRKPMKDPNNAAVPKSHKFVRDECGDMAEFESSSSCKYTFSNFSFKNLSQLASINYDLLQQSERRDSPKGSR
uniref:non-specific serine/threonine protein kinase n=1 Tax=Physcomitrium patens TaxID=3218 RepID=A0A7I4FUW0_PHYPA